MTWLMVWSCERTTSIHAEITTAENGIAFQTLLFTYKRHRWQWWRWGSCRVVSFIREVLNHCSLKLCSEGQWACGKQGLEVITVNGMEPSLAYNSVLSQCACVSNPHIAGRTQGHGSGWHRRRREASSYFVSGCLLQTARWQPQGATGGQEVTLLDMFSVQPVDGAVGRQCSHNHSCPSSYTCCSSL